MGGLREKALAAQRAGIHTVILPKQNMQDVAEIPKELKRKLTFIPVTHMNEVLEAALEVKPQWRSQRAPERSPAPVAAPAVSAKSDTD